VSGSVREATRQDSTALRTDLAHRALCGLALVGAFLLVLSEILPLYEVVVGTLETGTRTVRGWRNHAFAMLLFGAAAVPMALGALRGARPAMAALAALGVVVLVVILTVDLPAVRQSDGLSEAIAYEDARAQARSGFFAETAGGVFLLAAGGGLLLLHGRPRSAGPGDPARERERGALADAV